MSFLSTFKSTAGRVAQGIGNQVNPFDGGKTYSDAQYKPPQLGTGTYAGPQMGYGTLAAPAQNLYAPTTDIGKYYLSPAKAANFDVGGNYNRAYNQAASNINPLYDKYLNQFLQEQSLKTQAQQHVYDTTVQNLDTSLKNTAEANTLTQQRTGEDVATNEAQIAQKEDQFQTDSGEQNTAERLALAKANAVSGTTGGLGSQKVESQQTTRNTAEKRQGEQFDQQTAAQELFKARTFEDLAKSTQLATEKTTTGKASAKFDIDNYLALTKVSEEQYRTKAAEERRQAQIDEAARIARENYQAFLSGLSDPVRIATATKYNGSF